MAAQFCMLNGQELHKYYHKYGMLSYLKRDLKFTCVSSCPKSYSLWIISRGHLFQKSYPEGRPVEIEILRITRPWVGTWTKSWSTAQIFP